MIYSDQKLPMVDLTFKVRVPENTPADETVSARTLAADTIQIVDNISLENEGGGYWVDTVPVAPGSIFRYAYERWDGVGCCEARDVTKEGLSAGYQVGFRLLKITQNMAPVEDAIGLWDDRRSSFAEGSVRGVIVDRDSGAPVIDALVNVGGVHAASGYDGTFEDSGLPVGQHHVVIHSATGEFVAEQRDVTVTSEQQASVEIQVSHLESVNVRFEVDLPQQMPSDAVVSIAGNLRQMGGRPRHPTGNGNPDGTALPRMSIEGAVAIIDLQLPVGAFVTYTYTIGPLGLAASVAPGGSTVWYSFIVGDDDAKRIDRVGSFSNPDWPLTTLNVSVPGNTTPGIPISLRDGPQLWLSQIGPNRWSTVVGNMPPGTEFSYGYLMGASHSGADDSPDVRPGGVRTVTVGESDRGVEDVVTKWVGLPDPTARQSDRSLDVTFRLSAPPDTPQDAKVIITGSRPALGSGVPMSEISLRAVSYRYSKSPSCPKLTVASYSPKYVNPLAPTAM